MRRLLNGTFLFGLLGVILATHLLATYYFWYWQMWWFDIPMHLVGGFFLGALAIWYGERYVSNKFFSELNFLERLFLVLGMATLIGVFWEFYEFFLDMFLLKSQLMLYSTQLGAIDTMKDLADDILGALIAFLVTTNR